MVIRLDTSHTKALADVLCRAFYAEPLFTYMVPDEKARRALLPWFLSAAIRASHFCGENYTTPDLAGGALWIRPSCTFSIRRIVQRRRTHCRIRSRVLGNDEAPIALNSSNALGEPFFSSV